MNTIDALGVAGAVFVFMIVCSLIIYDLFFE